jgi:hypothetical protein
MTIEYVGPESTFPGLIKGNWRGLKNLTTLAPQVNVCHLVFFDPGGKSGHFDFEP